MAARFARSSAHARSASIVFFTGAFLVAIFITLHTLTLSGAQVVERDLGRFGASVGYGTITAQPGDGRIGEDLLHGARGAGASDAMVFLSATDVQLASGGAGGDPREIGLQEAPWASRPFPARYVLLSGRWPRRAGEIVLTEPDDVSGAGGARLSAFGGRVRFRMVGTADDRYARTSALLAAPGTWARLPPSLAKRFPLFRAQPVLFWSGNSEPRVVAAVTAVANARSRTGASFEEVKATLLLRDHLAAKRGQSWIERIPAAYTVPSLLLPLGAVWLAFGLNNRRFRRNVHVLTSLGIRLRLAVTSLSLAAAAWCLVAALGGALAGTILGFAARAVTAQVRGLPAGPVSDLSGPVLRLLGAVSVGAICAGLLLFHSYRGSQAPAVATTEPLPRGRGRTIRHLLALAVWCTAIVVAAGLDSAAGASILSGVLTVGVLLLVPEFVDVVLRLLPERGARMRLSRRQLAADRRRATAAIALLAVALGGSLGYLTLLTTSVKTLERQAYPDVLPGQVIVTDRSGLALPPPQQVIEVVGASDVLRERPRLKLRYLQELDQAGNQRRGVSLEGTIERIIALDSAIDVEHLLTHRLTSTQAGVLRRGGMLIWADTASSPSVDDGATRLSVTSADRRIRQPIEVPAELVAARNSGWRIGTSGVLLTSTARKLNLPMSTGATMYTGLSASKARAVQNSVIRAGLDARTVQLYRGEPAVVPPTALIATAAGLAVIALLAAFVAAHGQSRVLRGYLGRLISIGLSIAWARQVLLFQQLVVVAIATSLAVVIAVPPLIVAKLRITGFVVSIPWTQVLVLVATIYAATCVAALQSSRGIRARGDAYERP